MFAKVQTHDNAKDNAISSRRSPQTATQNLDTLTRQTHPATIIQRAMHDPGSLNPRDVLQLQRTIGNQAVLRLLKARTEHPEASSVSDSSPGLAHDSSRIPVHTSGRSHIQPKLKVNAPGDIHQREADRVAKQVMGMSEPTVQRSCACGGVCSQCKKSNGTDPGGHIRGVEEPGVGTTAAQIVQASVSSPGQPLDQSTRGFMESRFNQDFSQIRVHTDLRVNEAARAVQARAFTLGDNIVFGDG